MAKDLYKTIEQIAQRAARKESSKTEIVRFVPPERKASPLPPLMSSNSESLKGLIKAYSKRPINPKKIMIIYNLESEQFEAWTGSEWRTLG